MAFDMIGDVHGDASKLRQLLTKLGYRVTGATWRHTERQAIFLGDLIDRGPEQLATCDIVRNMIAAGSAQAVMGNHEFNAIAWFLEDPEHPGEHLRRHTEKNRQQHACFLSEVEHTPRHKEIIDWFLALPLWLEFEGLRVIHACWHPGYIADIAPYLDPGRLLSKSLVKVASREGTMAFRAVEGLLKGLETALPDGLTFLDKGGHVRNKVRVRWWNNAPPTSHNTTLLDDFDSAGLQNFPSRPTPRSVIETRNRCSSGTTVSQVIQRCWRRKLSASTITTKPAIPWWPTDGMAKTSFKNPSSLSSELRSHLNIKRVCLP